MKKSCLILLAVYLLLAAGLSSWFYVQYPVDPNVSPPPTTSYKLRAALAVGFLDAIPGLLSLGAAYDALLRFWRRDRLGRAAAGEPQPDGKQGVFFGTIRRHGPPLLSPLTKRECLLYRYEVTASGETTVAEGFALTPSVVEMIAGTVKLLTVVEPEFPADCLTLDEVAENYEAHAATARLQPSSLQSKAAVLRALAKRPREELRYDLGPHSRELRTAAPFRIEERIVQDGETVAVFGRYSAAMGAIVDEPESMLGARLDKGPLDVMQKRLMRSTVWFALGCVLWFALAAVGAWAFLTYGPPYIGWMRFRSIS